MGFVVKPRSRAAPVAILPRPSWWQERQPVRLLNSSIELSISFMLAATASLALRLVATLADPRPPRAAAHSPRPLADANESAVAPFESFAPAFAPPLSRALSVSGLSPYFAAS